MVAATSGSTVAGISATGTLSAAESVTESAYCEGTGATGNLFSETLNQSEDQVCESVEMVESGSSGPLTGNPIAALVGTQEEQIGGLSDIPGGSLMVLHVRIPLERILRPQTKNLCLMTFNWHQKRMMVN